MTSDSDQSDPIYLRSYGRRHGKQLRPGRKRLMAELLPQIAVKTGTPVTEQFGAGIARLWMEIGFGAGEHLAAQAVAHPRCGHHWL